MNYGALYIFYKNKINMGIQWKKVDSHIETRTYKEGQTPAGDEYSIRLNTLIY